MTELSRQQAIARLARKGIRTTADIDAYARAHQSKGSIPSRYRVLVGLVGERHAINIIESLANRQCT